MADGPEAVAALRQGANEAEQGAGSFDIANQILGEMTVEAGGIGTQISKILPALQARVIEKLDRVDGRLQQATVDLGSAATSAAAALDPPHPLLTRPAAIEESNVRPSKEALAETRRKAHELAGMLAKAAALAEEIEGHTASAQTHTGDAKLGAMKYQEDLLETAINIEAAMQSRAG